MKNFTLEACVDSVESALAAVRGGADRLELCGILIIGGTTPDFHLFQEIRRYTDIPIHVLIRPRFGDFLYTEHEFRIMEEDIRSFKELGAQGAVIGILKENGDLDADRMKILMEEAEGMKVTLHRAFDVCRDPFAALEQAKDLGVDIVLTSGQKNSCLEGKEMIRQLVRMEEGRITIQAGGGVNADVIRVLQPYTGVHAFHMSGKVSLESPMKFRRGGVPMGLDSLSEFTIFRTDEGKIREAAEALQELAR